MKLINYARFESVNFSENWKQIFFTTRKNGFNEGLFLHYLGLKPPLSHLPRVVVSPLNHLWGMCSPGFF